LLDKILILKKLLKLLNLLVFLNTQTTNLGKALCYSFLLKGGADLADLTRFKSCQVAGGRKLEVVEMKKHFKNLILDFLI
jgi:hypothetical protein